MASDSNTHILNNHPIVDYDKNTNLHYLCASGKLELVKEELNKFTKVDVENHMGWTPLMMACRNGHVDVVKYLLDKRANATKQNKYGICVFLLTIASGSLELVSFILQHLLCGGVSKQSLQKVLSPISLAVLFRQRDIVKYLSNQSFDLNRMTPSTGITPYMFAVALQDCKSCKLLIQLGCDESIKNALGVTATQIIASKKSAVKENIKPDNTANQYVNYRQQKHNVPMIILNSPTTHYGVLQSPAMAYNSSPNLGPLVTPNLTPMTPMGCIPQFVFPSNFSSNFNVSPMMNSYMNMDLHNSFLNQRMCGEQYLYTEVDEAGYFSPCV